MVLTAEQKKAYNRAYYKENKDKLKAKYRCEHDKSKYTCRICNTLKNNKFLNRNDDAEIKADERNYSNLLGCERSYFIEYIKNKLTSEMTLENIEIVFVRPIETFDLSNETDFFECMHYTNYKPILKTELR